MPRNGSWDPDPYSIPFTVRGGPYVHLDKVACFSASEKAGHYMPGHFVVSTSVVVGKDGAAGGGVVATVLLAT